MPIGDNYYLQCMRSPQKAKFKKKIILTNHKGKIYYMVK